MKALRWTSKQKPHSTSWSRRLGFISQLLEMYHRPVAITKPTWDYFFYQLNCREERKSYPDKIHKYHVEQKFNKSPEVDAEDEREASLETNPSKPFKTTLFLLLTVETNRRAARRTKKAGSSLANWALVSCMTMVDNIFNQNKIILLFYTESSCRRSEVCRTDRASARWRTQSPSDGSGISSGDTKISNK